MDDLLNHAFNSNLRFSGLARDKVQDFLRELQILQDACGVTDSEILRVVPVYFTDIASTWWEVHRHDFASFDELKIGLLNRFSGPKGKALSDVVHRVQGPSEPGAYYLDTVRLMWQDLGNHNFSEAARLDITYGNLRPEYRWEISRKDFQTFDQLEPLVLDYDWKRRRREREADQWSLNQVNPEHYCLNCQKFGHKRSRCHQAQTEIFCYVCGKRGVKSPDCTEHSPKTKS